MNNFSSEEIQALRDAYVKWPPDLKALSLKLGRKKKAILKKARKLGLTKNNLLLEWEKQYIRDNYKTKRIIDLGADLKRNRKTVFDFLKKEGLEPLTFSHNKWNPTEYEINYLKGCKGMTLSEIAPKLGKSIPTIKMKMNELGIPYLIQPRAPKGTHPFRIRIPKKPKNIVIPPDVPRNIDGESRIREAMKRIGAL